MRFKRCFSLLLAVLLAAMSFGFSASKAWALDTPPSLSGNYVGFYDNTCFYTSLDGYKYSNYSNSFLFNSSSYTPSGIDVVSRAYRVNFGLNSEISIGNGNCVFRGYFRSPYPIYGIYLHVWNSGYKDLTIIPCSVSSFSDNLYYYELVLDGSANSSLICSAVDVWFFEPDSSFNGPAQSPYPFIASSFSLNLSNLYFSRSSVPSASDKYQNNVSSGISQIKDSVQKGFSAVTGAIGGAASAVGEKIGQVKDAVVQQGQAVAQKITEVKEAVVEKTTEIKNTVVEKADEVKQTIIEKLEALGNFIIDGLKELFIPSEDYFPGLFERLNTFFADRFGFLYFPIEHFISMCNRLLTLQETAPSIAIPELSYEGQVFIPAQTYTFDFLQSEPFKSVHNYYLMAIDVALIMSFVSLLHRKYEEVMRN